MKLCHPLIHLATLIELTALVCGQVAVKSSQASTTDAQKDRDRGIVVERIARNSVGEKAGLKEGDILSRWSRGDSAGQTDSPLDLSEIEVEQSPRGGVTLTGVRGTESKTFLSHLGLGQSQTTPGTVNQYGSNLVEPGVVIEKFEDEFSGARKAGLQEGDVLLNWSRGDAGGKLESPFDLAQVLTEEVSRDAVRLEGLRGEKKWVWKEEIEYWGAKTRPNFSGTFLAAYRDGEKLADAGNLIEAAERWRAAAVEAERSQVPWLGPWFLFQAAQLLANGQKWKEADGMYQQAILQSARIGPAIDAQLLYAWGLTFYQRSDWDQAEKHLQQAVAESEKAGTENLTAFSLNMLGSVARGRGDLAKSEEYFRQVLEIQEKLEPGTLTAAGTIINIGISVMDRGDLAKSEEYLRKAWLVYEKLAPRSNGAAFILDDLGVIARERGDLDLAAEYYRKALVIEEKVDPGTPAVATILNDLARVVDERGDGKQAEGLLQQALTINEKVAPGSPEEADTHESLGQVAQRGGDIAAAEKFYLQALAIRERLSPEGLYTADALHSLGDVLLERGDLAKAEDYYRRALAIREKLAPRSMSHAETLAALAGVARRIQKVESAAKLYEQALDALEGQTARLGGANDVRAAFRATHAAYYKEYIDLLMLQKQPELAFQVLERSRARSLLEMLAEAHIDVHKGVDTGLLEQERSLRGEIAAKINRRINLLADKHTEDQAAAVTKEIEDLVSRYQEAEGQIRIGSPGYAALTQPQPLSAKQVQEQLLDNDTLLLEYSLGEERSYVFALTPNSLNSYELPKRLEIESKTTSLYDLLTERDRSIPGESARARQARISKAEAEYRDAASALSRILLGPVAGLLGQKRLLIVSDGALHYVPFAALPVPGTSGQDSSSTPLMVDHEIVNLPSASTLAVLRHEQADRKQPAQQVVVLADPVFDKQDTRVRSTAGPNGNKGEQRSKDNNEAGLSNVLSMRQLTRSAADLDLAPTGELHLPRLPFTRDEAKTILAVVPPGASKEALDFDASRKLAVSGELAKYHVVHFATHALVDNVHPELSGLVLSLVDQQGAPQEGFLDLQDIYDLDLPVDLVVLSACQTGLGKEINGEGMIGLTRGFMYAGASSVVSTLWKVDDFATAKLMGHFYRAMKRGRMTPAQALRQAQLALWKEDRWSAPYYWAGFTLQGEWK